MSRSLVIVVLTTSFGSLTSALNFSSPCPGLFRYDSTDRSNQWSGTLTLLSDTELHGVWIRLIFDGKLTGLDADNFGTVKQSDDEQQYLIKNSDFIMKAGVPLNIKIIAKYKGDEIPSLSGYRLNAKTICSSENAKFGQLYPGDLNNEDFLASVTSQVESFPYEEFEGCGSVPLSAENRGRGQWPWRGAIYIRDANGEKYVCEATLVTSRHVLTPAHCVTYQKSELTVPRTQLSVYLGESGRSSELQNKATQKLGAEKVLLYPGYRSRGLLNDLAVIRLDEPVIINDYVRPICLKEDFRSQNLLFLVGFGINDNQNGDLGRAGVEIISDNACLQKSSNLKGLLTDNVLCGAYTKGDSSCVGNSGSSAVSVRAGPEPIWELNGIVTVGAALQDKYLCDHSTTVLLLDLTNYLKWIQTVVS